MNHARIIHEFRQPDPRGMRHHLLQIIRLDPRALTSPYPSRARKDELHTQIHQQMFPRRALKIADPPAR